MENKNHPVMVCCSGIAHNPCRRDLDDFGIADYGDGGIRNEIQRTTEEMESAYHCSIGYLSSGVDLAGIIQSFSQCIPGRKRKAA